MLHSLPDDIYSLVNLLKVALTSGREYGLDDQVYWFAGLLAMAVVANLALVLYVTLYPRSLAILGGAYPRHPQVLNDMDVGSSWYERNSRAECGHVEVDSEVSDRERSS
jgi:hypothetical protein